ncbi:hypothetical protein [Rhodoflexus caldus]|uniref:hypothetical protein n=1 Tax=Rhodoflexus caldus TaxID=2891236 RepID=UPI00202A7F4B|nr:hypothetical protein [Rhodoflexus caldus]
MKPTVFKTVIESNKGFYTLAEFDSKGEYISLQAITVGQAKRLLDTQEFVHTVIAKDKGKWERTHTCKK